MALIDMPRARFGGAFDGVRLNALVGAVYTWIETRRTREALSALTDRELDDIGLARGDIDRIARL